MSCAASQVDGIVEGQLHLHRILIRIRVFNFTVAFSPGREVGMTY